MPRFIISQYKVKGSIMSFFVLFPAEKEGIEVNDYICIVEADSEETALKKLGLEIRTEEDDELRGFHPGTKKLFFLTHAVKADTPRELSILLIIHDHVPK